MRISKPKRKFETLILILGVLIAMIAGISSSFIGGEESVSSKMLKAVSINEVNVNAHATTKENTCEYLNVLSIN